MNDEQNSFPAPDPAEAAKPAPRRKAPARASRKKVAAPDAGADAPAGTEHPAPSAEAAPPARPRRPRKPKAQPAEVPAVEVTADLFAAEAPPAPVAVAAPAADDTPPLPDVLAVPAAVDAADSADSEAADSDAEPADDAGSRRRRKRRRGRGNGRGDEGEIEAGGPEMTAVAEAPPVVDAPSDDTASDESATEESAATDAVPAPSDDAQASSADAAAEDAGTAAEATPLPPLTVVSLGLDQPQVLSAEALAALRAARRVVGSAEALDRLAGLRLDAPQTLCGAETVHLDLRRVGHAGSVLVVVGDGAGDGPAAELLAELGPAHVRLLPGVGRVQAACAALGLSAEIVSVVDLRRAPLAALRGQLRAHRLLAVPVADAGVPGAVARLLVDSGFAEARVWVCEFTGAGLKSTAWLATELAALRDAIDPHAVLIVATGPSAGVFAELPGLSDGALGDEAAIALPLAARVLALAWLQPAAWETGWAISDGEASLALEWARAVPTARVRAVGVEPSLLGVALTRAGVGENLSAIAAASPLRCREWPVPEAVFVRGGVGLRDWLAAAWARLAPGGRLVASAEDDHARADLLAFAAEVPAAAWQELSLAHGETVAGRLRFAPAAPVRLALWRKEADNGAA